MALVAIETGPGLATLYVTFDKDMSEFSASYRGYKSINIQNHSLTNLNILYEMERYLRFKLNLMTSLKRFTIVREKSMLNALILIPGISFTTSWEQPRPTHHMKRSLALYLWTLKIPWTSGKDTCGRFPSEDTLPCPQSEVRFLSRSVNFSAVNCL